VGRSVQNTAERIRVAIIQSRLAPFRVAFFQRLANTGNIDLVVFCSDKEASGKSAGATPPAGVRLHTLKTFALGRLTLQFGLPGAILAGKFAVIIAEARLGLALTPLVLMLCRLTGKRFLWWTCGWEPTEGKTLSSLKRFGRRLLFAAAHGGIAYSKTAQQYLAQHGIAPEHTWIAHNSLDTDALLAIEADLRQDADFVHRLRCERGVIEKHLVLFVGKLTKTKNVELLLNAFKSVHRDHPEAVLWIVGDGPERARLESLARRSDGLPVQFLGETTEPRAINAIYMAADVFALPGTGGLAINQAMTFGKPVVVSSADGTEEDLVTDGHNGLYFKSGDAADLAAKIVQLLRDRQLRETMGRRSREIIETRVNMKNMVNSFCDAIFNRRSET